MTKEFRLRNLLRSSLLYGLSDVILKLIGFFLVPIYARAMSPAEYGIVGYTNAVSQVLTPVLGLGIVNCLPMLFFSCEGEERRRLVSTAVNAAIAYGLLCALFLTFVTAPLFSQVAGEVPFYPYIVISIWASLFAGFSLLPLGLFNIQNQPMPYLVFSLGLALANVASAVVLVVGMQLGALGVQSALLISGGVGVVATLFTLRSSYLPIIDGVLLKRLLLLSLPIVPHLLSGTLARFVDRMLLASLSTMATTGTYSLAVILASPVAVVMGATFAALGPMYYKRAAQGDDGLERDWRELANLYFVVGALSALGISLFAGELLAIFAPGTYAGAQALVPLLALAQLILGLYWLTTPAIGHARKTWIYPVASTLVVAVGVACNFALIPRIGAAGAAWATLIGGLVQLGLFYAYAQRCQRIHYDLCAFGLIAAVCASAYLTCAHWLPPTNFTWGSTGIKSLVMVLTALGALLIAVPAPKCIALLRAVTRGKINQC